MEREIMPRGRGSRASTSSEQSTSSDQIESLNLSQELPDPGLPKPYNKADVKEKKKVSFNFPVEVITKIGKFSGMGTIDLTEAPSDGPSEHIKAMGNRNEIVYDLTRNDKKHDSPNNEDPLENQDRTIEEVPAEDKEPSKNQDPLRILLKQPKKPTPAAVKLPNKRSKKGSKKHKKISPKEVREAKKKEADALKKWVDEDRRVTKEFEQIEKIFKPSECVKYMNVEIHPDLASVWFIKEMMVHADLTGVKVVQAEDICDPWLVMWTRFVPPTLADEDGQIKLTATKKQCDRALYIITAEEAVTLIVENRFRDHIHLKHELLGCKLTILVFGVTLMFQNLTTRNQKARINRDKFMKAVSDVQMELMVERQIDLLIVDSTREFSLLVTQYTKAIAEAPFVKAKRDIDEQAEFYMRGDNKNCVIVDQYGNGLGRLWEQMIAVLPKSSLEIARSIGAEYKTPRALLKEFQNPGGIAKVADIGVTRSNVPGAKPRRVGPEFARKLQILFTSEDGNMVIQ